MRLVVQADGLRVTCLAVARAVRTTVSVSTPGHRPRRRRLRRPGGRRRVCTVCGDPYAASPDDDVDAQARRGNHGAHRRPGRGGRAGRPNLKKSPSTMPSTESIRPTRVAWVGTDLADPALGARRLP